ncbi:MAG: tetratricopeptide repeat protein [Deltaproteobacteria bacterium]|nr:tetratricopeptide repeat protein [Deltaproteobacteria bacterium]
MSLIHDALKKVTPQGPPLKDLEPMDQSPRRSRVSVMVLVVILLAAGAFVVAQRTGLLSRSSPVVPQASAPTKGTDNTAEGKRLAAEGLVAFRAGDLEGALAKLTVASSLISDDPEIWNNVGVVARKHGDAGRAREAFEKALKLRPDYPECFNNAALLDWHEGRVREAREKWERALVLKTDFAEPHFHLGLAAEKEGDDAQAAEHYRQFLNLAKDLPAHLRERVRDHVLDLEL